jgi:molybdate transport system ATP-binding protein
MSFELRARRRLGERTIAVAFNSEARIAALVGPSGAGKTSVLNMIAGLLRPDTGRIVIDGQVLFDSASGTDLAPERRRIGYVFQDDRLFPHLRVRSNLLFGERLTEPADRWISYDEVTAFLGIAGLADRWPQSLSGGEGRRVAIGRALLAAPRLLLLDEPLTSLDAARREEVLVVIERIRDELKLPILYVSHDEAEVRRLTDELVLMDDA